MNPYEVLDVERTAAPTTVKMRWKQLSSRYHPDRDTGDAAKMAEVNAAYEILSDPEKRAHYDATGALVMPPPFDVKVEQNVMSAIATILSHEQADNIPDILDAAKAMIQGHLNEMTVKAQAMRFKRDKLRAQLKGIKSPDEKNLFQMVVEQRLADINQAIDKHYEQDKICSAALVLLGKYEREPGSMPAPTLGFFGAQTSTSPFSWR